MAVSGAIVFFGLLADFFVCFMAEEDAGYSHGDAERRDPLLLGAAGH